MRVTWRELAVDLSGLSTDDLLSDWKWLVSEELSLRMVSALGDAFLEDPSGHIFWLDTGAAELHRIADSGDHFDTLRQVQEYADQWFAPQLVGDLLSSGHALRSGQCFSYKIPLTLGGEFLPSNFEASDLVVHFSTLGQLQSQVRDLPASTRVSSVVVNE